MDLNTPIASCLLCREEVYPSYPQSRWDWYLSQHLSGWCLDRMIRYLENELAHTDYMIAVLTNQPEFMKHGEGRNRP